MRKIFILFLMLILTGAGVATTAPQFKKEGCSISPQLQAQGISELCYGQLTGRQMGLQITKANGVKVYEKSSAMNVQKLNGQIFIQGALSTGEKIQEILN